MQENAARPLDFHTPASTPLEQVVNREACLPTRPLGGASCVDEVRDVEWSGTCRLFLGELAWRRWAMEEGSDGTLNWVNRGTLFLVGTLARPVNQEVTWCCGTC